MLCSFTVTLMLLLSAWAALFGFSSQGISLKFHQLISFPNNISFFADFGRQVLHLVLINYTVHADLFIRYMQRRIQTDT